MQKASTPLAIKILHVLKFYLLLSNSRYLALLFDIITTHTEKLVTGHKLLHVPFIKVCHLERQPFFNSSSLPNVLLAINFFRCRTDKIRRAPAPGSRVGEGNDPPCMKQAAGVFEPRRVGALCRARKQLPSCR